MNRTAGPRREAKPFLSIDGASLWMRDGRAFEQIRWEILSDQQWAVIGPNGSGKSSLMKAICGRLPLAAGKIVYHFMHNGVPQEHWMRSTLPQDRIAYVAFDTQEKMLGHAHSYHQARWNRGVDQHTDLVTEYLSEHRVWQINPYQLVDVKLDPSRFAKHRERVSALLGIETLLAKEIGQLSNGERRKVQLARALLRQPRLLILDNPFTGLDAGFRAKLAQIIGRLMEGEMRLLLVTNGRDELLPGITHVLRMDSDGIVAQGPRDAVLEGLPAIWGADLGQATASGSAPTAERQPGDRVTAGEILVQMHKVNVAYGDVQVLNQVDWTVREGENWAVLGPNGAGKTTLLGLILGDNPQAYANEVTLFGMRRGSGESIWDIKRRIGWVAPELHLYYPKHVSCLEVVCSGFFSAIGCHQRCSVQQVERATWWLQRLGMWQFADTAFGKVSEGEQRMILVARALVKCPELLVLDEPCQGLDAGNRDRVLQLLEDMGKHLEASVIYVTHHRDALPGIITHVLRLDEGTVTSRTRVDHLKLQRSTHG